MKIPHFLWSYLNSEIVIYSFFCFFISLLLFLTNNLPELNDINPSGFIDIYSYISIANSWNSEVLFRLASEIPYHHLQRWPIHLLVGGMSSLFKVNLLDTYRFIIFSILLFIAIIIWKFKAKLVNKIIYFSIIILNPYSLRLYLYSPPLVHDFLFILVIVIFILAVINKNQSYLLLSIALSVFSRQTAIMLVPITITYCYFFPFLKKIAITYSILIVMIFWLFMMLTNQIFGPDPGSSLIFHVIGLFKWTLNPLMDGTFEFFRSFGFFIITLAPLMLLRISYRSIPIAFIGTFFIALQPILAGPSLTGSNAARLIAYSLPFIAIISLEKKQTISSATIIIFLLLMNSLHHWYSNFLPVDGIIFFGKNFRSIEIYGAIVFTILGSLILNKLIKLFFKNKPFFSFLSK
jgi:hypothetical protein